MTKCGTGYCFLRNPTAARLIHSAILPVNLSRAKRTGPVLSRSKTAANAARELAKERLAAKARQEIEAEK
ncbi:hypothetical protein MMC10_010838 [Thelotrema lepadinum]|nr:hypothetical protein [Thelotrema lepadinum]